MSDDEQTTDTTSTATAPAGAPSAAGGQPPAPASQPPSDGRPDIERLLAWDQEKDGEIPADLQAIPVTEVREYLTKHSSQVAAQTEAQVRDELRRQMEAQRQRDQQMASVEQEIRWAEELDKRRGSSNEDERIAAEDEYQRNQERYVSALARKHQQRQQTAEAEILTRHYQPQLAALSEKGYESFAQEFPKRFTEAGNNTILAAIEYGKSLGDAAGYQRGLDEGARGSRIADGQQSTPSFGPSGGGSADPFSGVNRQERGAGAEIMRRAIAATQK